MSLASLTVDLTLGLAKFESDSGKAAQIITRDQEKMSRAALNYVRALERQSDQATKTSAELQILKGATLGVGDDILAKVSASGTAFAPVGAQGAAAFKAIGAAAAGAVGDTDKLLSLAVSKIREVNQQAEALKAKAIGQNDAKTLTDDGLKVRLQQINLEREATLKQINVEFTRDKQAQQAAAAELAAGEARRAAAQKIIDSQNGLTATYRQQLAVLRELRDAGALTQAQFKQAGSELVAKQPVSVQRVAGAESARAIADAEVEATNRRVAALAKLREAVRVLNDKNAFKAQQDEAAAAKAVADAEVVAADRRIAAFEKLRATVSQLNFRQTRDSTETETAASARAASAAISANANATASAQAQVYTGFLLAQAAAAQKVAEAEARQAEISKQVGAAVERTRAAQEAAYATKVAYIGKVNEEAAALFRTRDAQRQLDAERAGVSSKEAAQLSKVTGDRELLANIYQRIEAEEQLAAAFGKSTAQILAQQAAERGISNTAAKPIARFAALEESNKAAAATAAATRENNAFVESVNRQANAISKLPSQLLAEEAALRGVSAQTALAIKNLSDFEKKTGQAGKGAFATANQLNTLRYTISDVVASAGSGISPLTILLQQGPQLAQVEGGITGIFKTILSFATPARLALTGVVTAIGAIGFAAFTGNRESKAFADSLVLTGGAAGVTEGQFDRLAKGIAASGKVTIGAAREFGQALISTGEIGPRVLGGATEAAARYGEATGKNAADVAKDFASMGQDVARWAVEHNKQLNFVTASQYDQIKSLQDQGRAAEAQAIVYEALNTRLRNLDGNLGTLDKILKATKTGWSNFWDAAFDIGRAETIESKLERAEKALDNVRERAVKGRASLPAFSSAPATREDQSAEARRTANLAGQREEEVTELRRLKVLSDNAAAQVAERGEITKRAIAGKELVKSYLESGKSASAYKKALDELTRSFKDNADAGTPFSENAKAEALAGLKKKFTDQGGVNDASSTRKALLDQDLKFVKDNFTQQQEAYQFSQQALQAVYATGTLSLKQFYDAKRAIITAGVDAELNALIDEQARLEVELDQGGFKNDADKIRVQTQLNESLDKSAKIRREAARATTLANIEEGASFKALNDRVEEFRANLQQLQGDEIGAARTRAALQAQTARQLATQSGGLITEEDLNRQARATALANDFAEVQRRVSTATADAARAEETYLLRATQTGETQIEQDKAIYLIRSTSLSQLGGLADKARELAEASSDPRIKQAAADLALSYQRAAETVDPLLNRVRDAGNEAGSSLANAFGNSFQNATSFKDLLQGIYKDLLRIGTTKFITEPLEKNLQGFFRTAADSTSTTQKYAGTSAESTAANYENSFDIASSAAAALGSTQTTLATTTTTQTQAVTQSTSAFVSVTTAANAAAQALAKTASAGGFDVSGFGNGYTIDYGGSTTNLTGGQLPTAGGAATGTNFVERDMLTILHKGEAVTPAAFNPYAPSAIAAAQQRPKKLEDSGSGRGGNQGWGNIYVKNEAGDVVQASAKKSSNGSDIEVLVRKLIQDENSRDLASGGGAISSGLKARGVNLNSALARRT